MNASKKKTLKMVVAALIENHIEPCMTYIYSQETPEAWVAEHTELGKDNYPHGLVKESDLD